MSHVSETGTSTHWEAKTPKSTYDVCHPCSNTASVNGLIWPNVKFASCGNRQILPSAIEPVRLKVPVSVPVREVFDGAGGADAEGYGLGFADADYVGAAGVEG